MRNKTSGHSNYMLKSYAFVFFLTFSLSLKAQSDYIEFVSGQAAYTKVIAAYKDKIMILDNQVANNLVPISLGEVRNIWLNNPRSITALQTNNPDITNWLAKEALKPDYTAKILYKLDATQPPLDREALIKGLTIAIPKSEQLIVTYDYSDNKFYTASRLYLLNNKKSIGIRILGEPSNYKLQWVEVVQSKTKPIKDTINKLNLTTKFDGKIALNFNHTTAWLPLGENNWLQVHTAPLSDNDFSVLYKFGLETATINGKKKIKIALYWSNTMLNAFQVLFRGAKSPMPLWYRPNDFYYSLK